MTQSQQQNVPTLRFPEFSEEWEGKYPLIGRQGALCGNVSFAKGKFYATEHAVVATVNSKTNEDWLYYKLIRLNLNRYATGQAQPGLSVNVIEKVTSYCHAGYIEQQKIAGFLSAVDERIEQITRKRALLEQYKKGMMQKLFSQELRFKDNNNNPFPDWEEKRLGDVTDVRDGTHDTPKYINDGGFPLITSKNLLKNGKLSFDDINYISKQDYDDINKRSNVNTGDIIFGMIGTIGNPVQVENSDFAIKNVTLLKQNKNLLNKYLIHFLKSSSITRQFHRQNAGGTQKFIALGIIRSLIIITPHPDEQKKISNFLSSIDNKIDLTATELTQAQAFKKGLLQQMFV